MPRYEKSVFINCPFDESYEPLLHAIVLTVAALGFEPRCARETEAQPEPRIMRIAQGLLDSKYSLHDLTKHQGEGQDNLARQNMPLELGMAMGIRYAGTIEGRKKGREHRWAALVPDGFAHQRFISDLSGYDPIQHDGGPETVIKGVVTWLGQQPDFERYLLKPRVVIDAYPILLERLQEKKDDMLKLTWQQTVECVSGVIAEKA